MESHICKLDAFSQLRRLHRLRRLRDGTLMPVRLPETNEIINELRDKAARVFDSANIIKPTCAAMRWATNLTHPARKPDHHLRHR